MKSRDFMALLTITLIVLGVVVSAIFLWLALILIILQFGAYYS